MIEEAEKREAKRKERKLKEKAEKYQLQDENIGNRIDTFTAKSQEKKYSQSDLFSQSLLGINHNVPDEPEVEVNGNLLEENKFTSEELNFLNSQKRIVLSGCGKVDPESIDSYISKGGYNAFKKALEMGSDKIIEEIKIANGYCFFGFSISEA